MINRVHEVYVEKPSLRHQKVAKRHHQAQSANYHLRVQGGAQTAALVAFSCGLITGTVGAWVIELLGG
jgi:hypothetical protein